MFIRDLLTHSNFNLTPAEARIAQVLLDEYPTSGLGTATALARRSGVSDPTVIRLVTKLGFAGFAAFQAKLMEEVEAGLRSPLMMMMEARRPAATGKSVAQAYLLSVAEAVESVADTTLPQLYERAVEQILGTKGRVMVLGGRFSRFVAGMLASYLTQFRSGVSAFGPLSAESFDMLLDLGKRDTLIVFDYRRYQTDVIRFVAQAAARGVSVILFTDPYRSPIAAHAAIVLAARTEVGSPYDSLAPPVAQIEALVAHLLAHETRASRSRVYELDRIRAHNAVTLESRAAKVNSAAAGVSTRASKRRRKS